MSRRRHIKRDVLSGMPVQRITELLKRKAPSLPLVVEIHVTAQQCQHMRELDAL